MILFRLLGAAVMALAVAVLVASFGPWAHAGAESLSRTEAGSVSMPSLALWVGIFAQLALDPRRARHWQPWAAVVVAAAFALPITIDVVRVAGSHVSGHGNLDMGWGLWTSLVLSQVLVLSTVAFAISSRGRISLDPPPWPSPWEFAPSDPLRSAVSVVALGVTLMVVGSFGPWGAREQSIAGVLTIDGVVVVVLAVLIAGLATSFYGPPSVTVVLRPFVLPLGAAALTVALLAITDVRGVSDLEAAWGIWLTVAGAAVASIGGALLVLVPLPNAPAATRSTTAPAARPVRLGPPLPPPPSA